MEYNLGNVRRDMGRVQAGIVLVWLGGILVSIAINAAIIYAVIHFVRKFW